MNGRWRSMALVVVLFTAMAVGTVWILSWQLQAQLRRQMLQQADARALQLADAMAGQTQAFARLADAALLDLRERWPSAPGDFALATDRALTALPPGLVSHVTVVDTSGRVVFNSLGIPKGLSMADQPHFLTLLSGGDKLVLGEPMQEQPNGQWLLLVARPILREGRFEGAVHLLLSTEFLAGVLGRLSLSPQDLVALVHPGGSILARSLDNTAAMGQSLPGTRPFLVDQRSFSGGFRDEGAVDGVPRLFGWHRMLPTGSVVVVGLSEAGVLEPLAQAQRQAALLTTLLSLALAGIGFWIGWLQWRLERGQNEMRQSQQRLQEAQQLAHLGHWTYDASSGHMKWSDEVARTLGHDPATVEPSFSAYWHQVCPLEKDRLRSVFELARVEHIDLDDVHRIVQPDGSERYVRLISLRSPGGDGPRYRGTLQDVTELRLAQLALERVNSGLEQRVKNRTRELQALNRELESFTYSVSHDLRTPLRSIHGFASLLQESESEALSEEGRDFLRRIQESSRRMGVLITDLLQMAQHSRADMHPEWVDLSALALQVVAELERAEPQRKVHWDIQPDLRAQADPMLIRVALQNLLGNAWKYTSQVADARIRLHSSAPGADGQTHFCVSDNGAGFDMAYASQLFQPFKRLHTHQQFEGTGIGLATVARVVQRHGGQVRGQGAVGQGASFCFSLPLDPVRLFDDSGNSLSPQPPLPD